MTHTCSATNYLSCSVQFQFSRSVVSDSLQPHELQHARPPCPSWTPGVHPNSCPSSRWCHADISYSVVPFSSCPQPLPASGSFPMSQLFAWGGQSIDVYLLSTYYSKSFICIYLIKFWQQPIYRWGNRGLERSSKLSRDTQLGNWKVMLQNCPLFGLTRNYILDYLI